MPQSTVQPTRYTSNGRSTNQNTIDENDDEEDISCGYCGYEPR